MNLQNEPQKVIAGRYRLVHLAGKGANGAVWRAQDLTSGAAVAIKFPYVFLDGGRRVSDSMRRETEALGRLRHQHIVRPIHFELDANRPFIVTEFAEGVSLEYMMGSHALNEQQISLQRVATIVHQMALAFEHAHGRNVVHRDIKPQNIHATACGSDPAVKVLDFGVARLLDANAAGRTTEGRILGSAFYMAPEQVRGEPQGIATDIFALSTVAFELLSLRRCWVAGPDGARSFFGEPIRTRDNALSDILWRIIHDARPDVRVYRSEVPTAVAETIIAGLSVRTSDRPRSMTELAMPFRALLASTGPPPGRAGPVETTFDAPTRSRGPASSPIPCLEAAGGEGGPTRIVRTPEHDTHPTKPSGRGEHGGSRQERPSSPVCSRRSPTRTGGSGSFRYRWWHTAAIVTVFVLVAAGGPRVHGEVHRRYRANAAELSAKLGQQPKWLGPLLQFRLDPSPHHRSQLELAAGRLFESLPADQKTHLRGSLALAFEAKDPELIGAVLRAGEEALQCHRRVTAKDLVGRYVRFPIENSWHLVTITLENGELHWSNGAGRSWVLAWSGQSLSTRRDCPYGEQALAFAARRDERTDEIRIAALVFQGETYERQ